MTSTNNVQSLETTLPYDNYVSKEIYNKEMKAIFSKNWILVGHTSQLANIGDFFTLELAGEPIIITHAKDGNIHALYNICPHRGTRIETSEKGKKKILQCSYHGWTFHLDGKVHRTPNFDTKDLGEFSCMRSIQLAIRNSMIFVNLDPDAKAFDEEYATFLQDIGQYDFLDSLILCRENQRVVEANWKAVVDNYLECDHCPIAHPGFSRTFDLSNYSIVPSDNYSYQCSTVRNKEESDGARFYWVWPNMMVSIYPGNGNMTTTQLYPLDEERTLAVYRYYFANTELTEEQEELIKFVDQVREEDFGLVELLQKGFHSKAFGRGIYSPTEQGLQYFHQLIGKAMNE
ncbi:aromatic ring-hydroxylating oxygenase subunit alpha [Bacillus massiliigorillae]|uniref:aromatic ring-hydroxylating oxygenase subunit alpha n=1 Tax=Bacillus massiliigorillae TaxID=1243664 RepID=UPI00039B5BDE|nr:SRPBCC family protein [Bacillus massiliigorillae]